MKMEKNSMEIMDKALAILKAKNPDTAYAAMVGLATASVDLKTAKFILSVVEKGNN
jgi:phosphohistidine swiveling domain-containing protein